MRNRKKLPEETVESGVVPLTMRITPNQVARSPASGSDRRATPIAPAIGSHSSRRALQKYSRRWLALSWRFAQSRSTYRSTEGRLTAIVVASRVSSKANAGKEPSPRSFHSASVSSAGKQGEPERKQHADVPHQHRRDDRRGQEEAVRRLHADGESDHQPGRHGVEGSAGLERAPEEQGAHEQEDHRLEVRETRQPERARQELLDVALVIVVAPEWNDSERQHDPHGGARGARTHVPRSAPRGRRSPTAPAARARGR